MAVDISIPDEEQYAYRRMLRSIPAELQASETFMRALNVYLKLGGLKLGLQRIAISTQPFQEEFRVIRRPLNVDTNGDEEESEDTNGNDNAAPEADDDAD